MDTVLVIVEAAKGGSELEEVEKAIALTAFGELELLVSLVASLPGLPASSLLFASPVP